MKKFRYLSFALCSGLLLAACSAEGPRESFFQVDYYSDYVGIDEDYAAKHFQMNKAELIGHAYAKHPTLQKTSGEEESSSYIYYGVGEPTKLEGSADASYRKSTRTAPEGYEWQFDKWAGFYDDGTEIDLSQIKGDCAVFALFKAVPINYSVTIEGLSNKVAFFRCNYGEKLADNEEFQDFGLDADPTSFYGDPYYETSSLKGLKYMIGDEDHSSEVTSPYYSFIANNPTKGNTKYVFEYDEPVKHTYTVTYKAVVEPEHSTDPLDEAAVLVDWTQQTVEYDGALIKPDDESVLLINPDNWTYVRAVGEYGEEAKSRDSKLGPVDPECIRYDCTITLTYRPKAQEKTVKIYDEFGAEVMDTVSAYVGKPPIISAPNLACKKTGYVGPDYSWTGLYVKKDTNEIYDPDAIITDDLEIVPVCVLTNLEKAIVLEDKSVSPAQPYDFVARYVFNKGYGGYCLEKIVPGAGVTLVDSMMFDISASNIENSVASLYGSMTYKMVAIQSFGTSSFAQLIYDIALPLDVTTIFGTSFRGMTNIATLDFRANTNLSYISDFAFDRLASIEDILLPSSISKLGHRIINECFNLEAGHLYIDMTEDEFLAKVAAGGIESDWNQTSVTSTDVIEPTFKI